MALSGVGSLMNNYYAMTNNARQMAAVSKLYDYKPAQSEVKSLLDVHRQRNDTVSALKKETANFLTQYTRKMTDLNKAASSFTNGGVSGLLYNRDGAVTQSTIQNTVDATKGLLGQYNETLQMLDENAGRGHGVLSQLSRMADGPAAREKLEQLGISAEEDGTLTLDEEKLTAALRDENPRQLDFMADLLGGSTGLAAGIRKDAQAGLKASAGSLVNNDIAETQKVQEESPIRGMYQNLRGGAYTLNNYAATGMLMNMLA